MHPLTRRYRTDHFSLRYCWLNTQFYSDTVFATTKSLKGNKCAQVFTAKDFIRVHSMVSRQECAQALQVFSEDVGMPSDLCTDGAAKLTDHTSEWRKLCRELRVKTRESRSYTQSQNQAKTSIRELKKRWKHKMVKEKESMRDSGILGVSTNRRSCQELQAGVMEEQELRESLVRPLTSRNG